LNTNHSECEIERAVQWFIDERSLQTAERFLEQVRDAARRISEDAEFFPVLDRGVRWVKLEDFKCVVNFLILDDRTCRIYSVSHTSRRPKYWYRRLPRPQGW
jgi:hypothetical protein